MSDYYLSRGDARFIFHAEHVKHPDRGTMRPVAVIDYEDREQVARLVELLGDHGWRPTTAHGLRDALREFANPTPPTPDEPTGARAVVEGASGCVYIRMRADEAKRPWLRAGTANHVGWDEMDDEPLRVIFEGVTA